MKKIINNCTVIIISKEYDYFVEKAVSKILFIYDIKIIIVTDIEFHETREQVKIIKSENPLLGHKRNRGAKECRTKYIAFLDSDAYPGDSWLVPAIEILDQRNLTLVGGPNLEYQDLSNQKIPHLAYKSFLVNSEPSGEREQVCNYLPSSNWVLNRKEYLKLGGMNEELRTGEDIEFCFRWSKNNGIVIFNPNVKVHHRQRGFLRFLGQRFIWGRGTINVLRNTFPHYTHSLLPLIGVITNTIIFFKSLDVWIIVNSIYFIICTLESIRVARRRFILTFPYIYSSLFVIGFGTFYSLIFGDIKKDLSNYISNK